jgi:hypothetical protein
MVMVSLSMTGCATILKQKTRVVSFDSNPQGADVYLNGDRAGQTPFPYNLSNLKSVNITFKKDGYLDKTYIINTEVGGGWVVADIFGLTIINILVDACTNNWLNLDTSYVKVLLDPIKK